MTQITRRRRERENGGVEASDERKGRKRQTWQEEKSRFWLESHNAHVSVRALEDKMNKGEKTAEREQSSLTVDGVMKEGGHTASDDLEGDASSHRSSAPSSNLQSCHLVEAEMSSSESCSPTDQCKMFR